MKKVLKIFGIALGIFILILILAGGYINFSDIPTYEVNPVDLTIKTDSAAVAEGRRMAIMTCYHCHLNEDKLDGMLMEMEGSPFGKMWASNITQHEENGIGKYTDGELAYLFRTGVKRNGECSPPWMPKFPNLSDEDMNNLIAWLRSDMPEVQPSDQFQPKPEYSFFAKILLRVAFKPLPYDGAPIKAPLVSDKVAYGKYLATAKIDCYSCHSPDFKTMNHLEPEKTPGFFSGGNPLEVEPGTIVYSANLTPDKETGIGNWSEEDFSKAVKHGQRPDGTVMRAPMRPFPLLTDEELSAIFAYLQSIPATNNDVKAMN